MVDARNDIVRTLYNGRVYHWQRSDPNWPGHIAYIVLRVDEIRLGDRYRAEGYECSFACELREFLNGCFHDSVRAVFGAEILEEVCAVVRDEVGPEETVEADRREPTPSRTAARGTGERDKSDARAREPAAVEGKRTGATAAGEGRVNVAITRCERVDLTLATALKTVTRAPIRSLLDGLRQLPYIVANDVSVDEALAVESRLAGLGAKIELK